MLNSRSAHFAAAPSSYELYRGTPSPEVTGLYCRVPYQLFSRAPLDILLVYLCRFEVRFPTTLLRGFSWQRGIGSFQPYGLMLYASLLSPSGFACSNQLTRIEPHSHRRSCLSFCVSPSSNESWEVRNVDRMSISYAFRPRLRDRLTLSGLTFLRKP